MIKKIGTKYRLESRANSKNLGTYSSKAAAQHREKQVEYFKHVKNIGKSKQY